MAIKEQDKVFYEELANGDKVINLPVTRANNVEGLGRSANTAYSEGNVVYVDSNLSVALKCTTSGTTSNTELDISGKAVGDTVTDGGVVWQVCNRTSDVTSVNGKTGDVVVDTLPVGIIISYAGNTTPSGFLDCNGASLNPNTYVNLFNEIGITYGGDGSTTFNLPNLNNGSFLEGSDTVGTVKNAGLPNIKGGGNNAYCVWSTGGHPASGAFYQVNPNGSNYRPSGASSSSVLGYFIQLGFDASKSNSIYKDSVATVQPKAVTVKYCIKY